MTEQAEHHELSDEEYSKKVKKRIGKEVAKRKTAEDSFKVAQEEAANWRKKAEEAETRLEETAAERVKRAKEENRGKLKQAFEDGDTEKQAEYTEEFSKLNSEETEYERRKRERTEKKEDESEPAKSDKSIHPSAEAFLDRSKGWFESNSKARDRAIELEKELRSGDEAMDLGDDLYDELESRLFDEMPELGTKDTGINDDLDEIEEEEEEDVKPKTDVSAVTPSSRGQGRRPRRSQGGDHMSDSMKATMKRYGFDPKNAEHIKGFLKHHKGV